MSLTDAPWGWQKCAHLDHDLYEDARQVIERGYWSDEKKVLSYVAGLMRTGAVSERQGNELLAYYGAIAEASRACHD